MKRMIDGMMYNTDTANHIDGWANGCHPSDFEYYKEDLYVTKKGAYFIAGEGGPSSRYGKSNPGGRQAGEGLRAVTTDEAREWCETHDVPADVIS